MTPPRNRIKPRKPESQIARKPAWSPGFLQKRLLQTRGCAAVINRFVILHGRLIRNQLTASPDLRIIRDNPVRTIFNQKVAKLTCADQRTREGHRIMFG